MTGASGVLYCPETLAETTVEVAEIAATAAIGAAAASVDGLAAAGMMMMMMITWTAAGADSVHSGHRERNHLRSGLEKR